MQVVGHGIRIGDDVRFCTVFVLDAIDVAVVMVRQLAGFQEVKGHLQETEAHQRRTQRDRAIDDPGRPLQVGRGRPLGNIPRRQPQGVETGVVQAVIPNEGRAQRSNNAGEQGAAEQPEDDEFGAHRRI